MVDPVIVIVAIAAGTSLAVLFYQWGKEDGRWEGEQEAVDRIIASRSSQSDAERASDLVCAFSEKHNYSAQDQTLVLYEESGELAEEVLKDKGGKLFKDNSNPGLREEIGDVQFTLWSVAYIFGIDPIEAGRETAEENVERVHEEEARRR